MAVLGCVALVWLLIGLSFAVYLSQSPGLFRVRNIGDFVVATIIGPVILVTLALMWLVI